MASDYAVGWKREEVMRYGWVPLVEEVWWGQIVNRWWLEAGEVFTMGGDDNEAVKKTLAEKKYHHKVHLGIGYWGSYNISNYLFDQPATLEI